MASQTDPCTSVTSARVAQPVCVLGMHRSGTSLIAGALHRLGVNLGPPQRLLAAHESNETGHWEHRKLVKVSDKVLHRLGGSWDRPPDFGARWHEKPGIVELEERARAAIERDFATAEVWGWKDPRTCVTLPFWRRVVPEPRYVVCLRDPAEVSASLTKRDGLAPARGIYLWLRYTVESLGRTHDRERELFIYEDFLREWQRDTPRLARLARVSGKADLDDFIDPDLRHQSASEVDLRASGAGDAAMSALEIARSLYAQIRRGAIPDPAAAAEVLARGTTLLGPELARLDAERATPVKKAAAVDDEASSQRTSDPARPSDEASPEDTDSGDETAVMRDDWDARAEKDAMYYIASGRKDWTLEEFLESGRRTVDETLTGDLELLCGGRDPRSLRLLEIGCGIGRMTKHLAELFGEVDAIDVSEEMIRRARDVLAGVTNVRLEATNGRDLAAFEDESFDVAYSYIVFQHIPYRDVVVEYLREVRRTLKSGGMFKFQVDGRPRKGRPDTWRGVRFGAKELADLATTLGYEVVATDGAGTHYFWNVWRA